MWGDWISPTITALTDAIPYPKGFDSGIAAMLALMLAAKYELQAQVTPLMTALASSTQAELNRRYGARRMAA